MRQVFQVTYTVYDNNDGTIKIDTDTKIVAVKNRNQINVTLARYHDLYAGWITDETVILIHDCILLRYDE